MSDAASTPTKLGRYEIVSVLGRGAMGVVYEARDPKLGRRVAIKTLDKLRLDDPQGAARFLREGMAAGRVSHPNIVGIYDAGEEGELAYLVMELISGGSLQERLQPGVPFAAADALRIAGQLLDALACAHDLHIVHRDVKPANVMLDAAGSVKLADFGVARVTDAAERTMAGTVIGTPRYMAPEQISGQPVGRQADIFASGALCYRLFTGFDAFEGDSLPAVLAAVMLQEPRAPSQRAGAGLPIALDTVLLRALAKDPQQRYADARAFSRALHEALAGLSTAVVEFSSPELAFGLGPAPLGPGPAGMDPFPDLLRPAPASAPEAGGITVISSAGLGALLGAAVPSSSTPIDGTLFLAPPSAPGSADTGASSPAVQLVVTASGDPRAVGRVAAIESDEFVLGRDAICDFVVQDTSCSRRHTAIRRAGAAFTVQDLGSTNGTWLDGRPLEALRPRPLFFGSAIRIGDTTLTFTHARDTTLPDLTGQVLAGRYRLERVLRASPKATVYAARLGDTGSSVALKLLSPELARYPGYGERFVRAAQAATKLQHPHICQLIDHGMAEVGVAGRQLATHYLCHTLLGDSLGQRIAALDAVPTAHIGRWLEQIGSALAHAHRKGVVHGDLKPTSIAFDDEDNAYLMDFTMVGPVTDTETPLMGAPAYMAPELWLGASPSQSSDQFALAAVAYAVCTGARPFIGQEDPKQRERNFRRGAPPAHEEARAAGRADVPRAVSDVLKRALAAQTTDRYESVAQFSTALRDAWRGTRHRSSEPMVFVSYQHESSAGWAVLLARELKDRHRIKAFVDTQRLDAAMQFPAKLAQAIERCEVFVCLLAQHTLSSRWVREEIRLAHEHRKPMIPVFQESFTAPERGSLDAAVESLLQFDGVHLLDRRNIHVDHTIDDLARLVTGTLRDDEG